MELSSISQPRRKNPSKFQRFFHFPRHILEPITLNSICESHQLFLLYNLSINSLNELKENRNSFPMKGKYVQNGKVENSTQ